MQCRVPYVTIIYLDLLLSMNIRVFDLLPLQSLPQQAPLCLFFCTSVRIFLQYLFSCPIFWNWGCLASNMWLFFQANLIISQVDGFSSTTYCGRCCCCHFPHHLCPPESPWAEACPCKVTSSAPMFVSSFVFAWGPSQVLQTLALPKTGSVLKWREVEPQGDNCCQRGRASVPRPHDGWFYF